MNTLMHTVICRASWPRNWSMTRQDALRTYGTYADRRWAPRRRAISFFGTNPYMAEWMVIRPKNRYLVLRARGTGR